MNNEDKLIYSKTITKEGNECFITKNVHVVEVNDRYNNVYYLATCSTFYKGWFGTDFNSQSYVYDAEEEAITKCKEFLNEA